MFNIPFCDKPKDSRSHLVSLDMHDLVAYYYSIEELTDSQGRSIHEKSTRRESCQCPDRDLLEE